jgi:hypothetical protein
MYVRGRLLEQSVLSPDTWGGSRDTFMCHEVRGARNNLISPPCLDQTAEQTYVASREIILNAAIWVPLSWKYEGRLKSS